MDTQQAQALIYLISGLITAGAQGIEVIIKLMHLGPAEEASIRALIAQDAPKLEALIAHLRERVPEP